VWSRTSYLTKREVKETVALWSGTKLYDRPLWLRALDPAEFGKQEDEGMRKKLAMAIAALGLSTGVLMLGTPAQAQGVKVGVITCNVSSGFGFIFGSSRAVNCTFSPGPGHPEHYVGAINKFGVDIGYVAGGVLVWSVVAPAANPGPCALAGTYGGATGSATVGVGLGANVLVGGSSNSVALQPVSFEGSTGLNVAAGVAEMTLTCQP
jgi:hypothetical protein